MNYTRPGRLSDRSENPEAERDRLANLEHYISLANRGLPIFEGQDARGMEAAGFGMYDVGAFMM